eukprot:XP_001704928.1 Hypothetical protein GL50803_97380 [Giardia lamblia ATCC 50803]
MSWISASGFAEWKFLEVYPLFSLFVSVNLELEMLLFAEMRVEWAVSLGAMQRET